jgi:uncharacterized membrane protein
MTELLFLVAVLVVIWIARSAAMKAQRTESLVAKLTSRVFNLEEELKQLRKAILGEGPKTQPAPSIKEHIAEPAPVVHPFTAPEPPPAPAPAASLADQGTSATIAEPEPAAPLLISLTGAPPSSLRPPLSSYEPGGFTFAKLLNIEDTLGTNWLNKLGITIFVIGVALFLAYEMRELGPSGKVTVGYVVSAVMLGAGIFFERRAQWQILARAGIAGGWSLAYFTTYALYHVPAAHILSSEAADLGLLLIVAVAMVLHTLRYNSQVVTGLAFLLAFTTVNISRGNAYSLIASAILAGGLAVVALYRRWFEMEIVGMAAAYLNHYLWLRPIIEPMHGHVHVFPGYPASAVLLYGYWLIFLASYVLRRVDDNRQEQVSTVAALLNPALFVAVMGYQSVHPELAFQFFLGAGAVEFLTGQLPITRRRRSAFVVLTTLGFCLLVAAFPYRYSRARLSASWLAEAEALLLVGVFLREIVFRRLGMLAALATWINMIGADAGTVFGERVYGVRDTGQPGLALLFAVAAAVFYINCYWLPRRWPDLIQTDLEGLCLRRLSHMVGILAFIGAWIAWPQVWTAVAWAALGVTLAFAGQRWQLREMSIDGVGCAAAAVLRVLFVNIGAVHTDPHLNWMTERLLTVSVVVALLYLGSRWTTVIGTLAAGQISAAYTWAATALAALLAWYELRPVGVALGWSLLALILLEAGLNRRSVHLRLQAYVAFVAGFVRLFFVNLNAAGPLGEISPRVYTTAPLALAFYYVYGRLTGHNERSSILEREAKVAECHCFLGTVTLAALMRFDLDLDLVVVAWAALVLLLVAIAWNTGRRIFLHQGLLLSFGVLFRGIFHNLYERSYFPAPFGHGRVASVGTAVALLFLVLPLAFRLRRMEDDGPPRNSFLSLLVFADRRPEQIFFFIPFILLTALLAVDLRSGLVTLAWGVEAVGVFSLALWVKERSYRLSGLGLLLLCVGKIVLRDVWGLAPRDRYLTFIVLGSALLAVSYLYTRFRHVLRQYL